MSIPTFNFTKYNDFAHVPGAGAAKLQYLTIKIPSGDLVINKNEETGSYSCFFKLNQEDEDFTGTPGHLSYVKVDEVKVTFKTRTFKANDEVEIYDKPEGNVIGKLSKDTVCNYIDDDSGNDEYLAFMNNSKESFFKRCNKELAKLLFENRDQIPSLKTMKNISAIEEKMKDPIYHPINKDTGEYLPNEKKSFFMNAKYYKQSNEFKTICAVPTSDISKPIILTKEQLCPGPKGKSPRLTLIDAEIEISGVFIKGKEVISPQWKFKGGIVTKITPPGTRSISDSQSAKLSEMSRNTSLTSELASQLQSLNIGEEEPAAAPVPVPVPSMETTTESDLQALLDGGENIEIPGLPDLN